MREQQQPDEPFTTAFNCMTHGVQSGSLRRPKWAWNAIETVCPECTGESRAAADAPLSVNAEDHRIGRADTP
jgi:hypothetical protein